VKKNPFRRGRSRLSRQLGNAALEDAMGKVQAIPPGTRIYTSVSPKIAVAHIKSGTNPGAACPAMSERTGPWLGTGSDEERTHAASLRLCSACARAEGQAVA
jgi:hypothetical protein